MTMSLVHRETEVCTFVRKKLNPKLYQYSPKGNITLALTSCQYKG